MGDSAALFDGQDDNSDLQFGFNKEFADRLEVSSAALSAAL